MGSKPIHRRTDVPLEGKEKSQSPELPSQPFTLEEPALFCERCGTEGAPCKRMWIQKWLNATFVLQRLSSAAGTKSPSNKVGQLQGLTYIYFIWDAQNCI